MAQQINHIAVTPSIILHTLMEKVIHTGMIEWDSSLSLPAWYMGNHWKWRLCSNHWAAYASCDCQSRSDQLWSEWFPKINGLTSTTRGCSWMPRQITFLYVLWAKVNMTRLFPMLCQRNIGQTPNSLWRNWLG